MKKLIRASHYPTPYKNPEYAAAKQIVRGYDDEQIQLVKDCLKEEANLVHKYSINENSAEAGAYDDYPLGVELSGIQTDYMLDAIESDLLTEEEWNELYDALNTLSGYDYPC